MFYFCILFFFIRILFRRNQKECSEDMAWMCNWFAFSHLHVTVLLACMSATTNAEQIRTPLACLCCILIMIYVAQGFLSSNLLHGPMAAVQCAVYGFITGSILFLVTRRERTDPVVESRGGDRQVKKASIATTAAMVLQLVMSAFRLFDMTFGSGREGYLGDMSR